MILDRVHGTSGLVVTPFVPVPGIATASAYTAADAFGSMGVFKTDIAGHPLPVRGIIVAPKLLDPDDDTLSLTVHIFNEAFTDTADHDALALVAADATKWVTSMNFDDGTDMGAFKGHEIQAWNSPYYSKNRELLFQCSTAGTPNIAAGAIPSIQLCILPFAEE